MIHFFCPHCREEYHVDDRMAATRAKCDTCGKFVDIPGDEQGMPMDVTKVKPKELDMDAIRKELGLPAPKKARVWPYILFFLVFAVVCEVGVTWLTIIMSRNGDDAWGFFWIAGTFITIGCFIAPLFARKPPQIPPLLDIPCPECLEMGCVRGFLNKNDSKNDKNNQNRRKRDPRIGSRKHSIARCDQCGAEFRI